MIENIKKTLKVLSALGVLTVGYMLESGPSYAQDNDPCSCWSGEGAAGGTTCCYGWGYCSYEDAACVYFGHKDDGYGYWGYDHAYCDTYQCPSPKDSTTQTHPKKSRSFTPGKKGSVE